jgi:hypothetical protein
MIDAVREQLTLNPTVQLTVTFVVQQALAFDSFKAKLKPSSTASRSRSPSPLRSSNPESSYFVYIDQLITSFLFYSRS